MMNNKIQVKNMKEFDKLTKKAGGRKPNKTVELLAKIKLLQGENNALRFTNDLLRSNIDPEEKAKELEELGALLDEVTDLKAEKAEAIDVLRFYNSFNEDGNWLPSELDDIGQKADDLLKKWGVEV